MISRDRNLGLGSGVIACLGWGLRLDRMGDDCDVMC